MKTSTQKVAELLRKDINLFELESKVNDLVYILYFRNEDSRYIQLDLSKYTEPQIDYIVERLVEEKAIYVTNKDKTYIFRKETLT
jgi:hypothetical protein